MADVKTLTWGYKFTREIACRMPYFRGEPAALHPAFALGSAAAIVPHAEGPIAFDAPRIDYTEEDERALDAYARATSACETFCATMVFNGLPLLSPK
jgi:alcohol oxidase